MAIPTEVIMRMATLGLNEEQARAVADMLTAVESATAAQAEAVVEQGRAKVRNRVQKWRDTHKSNVTKRSVTSQSVTERLVHVEDKTLTSEIEPQESKKQNAASGDLAQFKAKLAPLLDAPLLDAFVKVRRAKRAAFTELAAGLFIGDAEKCGMSVSEAATECVRSNWITVKPEYFQHRQRAGPATPKPNQALDVANQLMEKFNAIPPSETEGNHPYPRLVASGIG